MGLLEAGERDRRGTAFERPFELANRIDALDVVPGPRSGTRDR